jgi:hypothetical protein
LRVHGRNTTSVAADTASVTHIVCIPESLGWCKVQPCKGSRLSEQVSIMISFGLELSHGRFDLRAGHGGQFVIGACNWFERRYGG